MARLLFVMPEIGYLRMYGTTLRALAARGHDVRTAFSRPPRDDRDDDALKDAPPGLSNVGVTPQHAGPWRDTLIELGCTIDYLRFVSPRERSPYLRTRMERYLPARAAGLAQVTAWPQSAVLAAKWAVRLAERALPVDPALTRFLEEQAPDAVVITPLVLRGPGGVQQTQLVKAARVLGIPVGLAVASWDHLSSKGLIRVMPDLVLVWNDVQKREAIEMHGVPSSRVVTTGAQLFDLWFGREPTLARTAFLERVGLPTDRAVVLYAGSSRGIANPEREIVFVREWLSAIRRAADPALRSAAVLIRPHLSNVGAWATVDLTEFAPVSIWPRSRPRLPMNALETSDYFHSLHYSDAVVGINTSAMIESLILDRPVLTVEVPAFADTQRGTAHFHYLVPSGGGPVESSSTFEEHTQALAAALANPAAGQASRRAFVSSFVRPRGLEREAVDAVVEAIERLPTATPSPLRNQPAWLAPARWLLRSAAGPSALR